MKVTQEQVEEVVATIEKAHANWGDHTAAGATFHILDTLDLLLDSSPQEEDSYEYRVMYQVGDGTEFVYAGGILSLESAQQLLSHQEEGSVRCWWIERRAVETGWTRI